MAPRGQRRSSYSRRAQYNLFTGYIIAGAGALLGTVLLAVSLFNPGAFAGLRGQAVDAAEPVTQASSTTRAEGIGFFDTISGYYRAGSTNAELKREMEIARIRLAEAAAVRQENARLKALLGLRDAEARPVAVTRLVGSSASSTRRFGYIGAGSDQGVRVGMPVRSPRGVVGRVLEVSSDSARVLLLTDSESVLPVRRASDDVVAFAEGRGDSLLRIKLINLGINPLRKNDLFVTSGAGGFYRPGTAVAIVETLTDDGAFARIVADPAATDFVAVEPIFEARAVAALATPADEELGD